MSCDFVDVSLFEKVVLDLIQPDGVELLGHQILVSENGIKLDIHHLHVLQLC